MEILKSHNNIREDGHKNSTIKYFNDTRPVDKQGNTLPFEVAIVAKCVQFYRSKMTPLKTIWLSESGFNEFEYWARVNMTEQQADSTIEHYTFDGVFIEKMAPHHVLRFGKDKSMDWEFYPVERCVE